MLVTSRLAACVQVVGPITSRYRWQGEIETTTEWLLIAKSTSARADDVVAAILDAHPYDVPEVLVMPVVGGNAAYLAWIEDAVAPPSDAERA